MNGLSIKSFAFMCLAYINSQAFGQYISSGTDEIRIKSEILSEERDVLISLPSEYNLNNEKYTTLYVLDADVNFGITNEIIKFLSYYGVVEETIVVGIPNLNSNTRNRDFTYTKSTTYPEDFPTAGGGAKFKEFIDREVIPFVDSNYRTSSKRILTGHSMGGLFVLNTVIYNDTSFSGYIAISPTLWWNERELLEKTKTFLASKKTFDKYVFISRANESEKNIADVKSLKNIYESFDFEECRIDFHLYPSENHASTLIVATSNALAKLNQ